MLLKERDRRKLEEFFRERLVHPVRLVLFTQEPSIVWTPRNQPCQFCKETEQLVQELVQLSPMLEADIHDIDREGALAERYRVDKVPALIIADGNNFNIRYFGFPGGMEFTALIEDIVMVSQGATQLSEEVREKVRRVQKPVHIQVFVTPTCPYCPRAVRTAHQFALENPHIVADMVEATEFFELAERYRVFAVPKVVINDTVSFEGALPEHLFALYVLKAADQLEGSEAFLLDEVEEEITGGHEHAHHHHDEFEHEHHFHRYDH